MNGDIAAFIVMLMLIALAAWMVWLDAKRREARIAAHTDLQHRLLEKFSSPQDVAQFLQTEGGRRFLQGLTADTGQAARRILRAMQVGAVFSLVGLAAIGLGLAYPDIDHNGHVAPNPGVIIGSLVLAFGAGFLISAALSYRISRAWGLLKTDANGADLQPERS
jgi:hypothetical protein